MYWFINIFLSFMVFQGTILSHDWPLGRFNAAFNKTTYQSSTYNYPDAVLPDARFFSDNAVDGNHNTNVIEGSCTHTKHTQYTWWAVDLGLQYYIYSVTLTNILSTLTPVNGRLHNFRITGSNTSYVPGSVDAMLCAFQLEPMGGGETKTFTCMDNFSARFVIINKETPVTYYMPLELCEVEVKAKCLDGFYGKICSQICSENFVFDSLCNVVDGSCFGGCKSGYTSNKCDQVCPDGTYGVRCSGKCSENCQNSGCDKFDDTGICLSGCIAGYYGDHCNITCAAGTYGKTCKFNCGGNCLEGCDPIYGSCYGNCPAGFTGNTCNTTCLYNTYGVNCLFSCGINCAGGTCDVYNGNCNGGCIEGYLGDRCDRSCDFGYYGKNCSNSCRNCLSPCDKITGSCSQDCSAGYTGDGCKMACSPGYYELGCESECKSGCQDVCNHVTGSCKCEDGYSGLKCDIGTSEGNGNVTIWIVVCLCITACVIAGVIGLAVCKVMKNRNIVTKTNEQAPTRRTNNDVPDSGIALSGVSTALNDITNNGVQQNAGFPLQHVDVDKNDSHVYEILS